MRRILFVNNTSQLDAGTSRSLMAVIKLLRGSFDMGVALDEECGQLPASLRQNGVCCHVLPRRTWRYLPILVWTIVHGRYELVYANNFSGRSANAAWAAALTRRPLIWHVRESLTPQSRTRSLRLARAIIANSHDTAKRIEQYAPEVGPRIVTIPNGVDADAFETSRGQLRNSVLHKLGIPTDAVVIMNVGRVCHQKNQLGALRAAAAVLRTRPNTWLILVGPLQEGEYARELEDQARTLGIRNQVCLPGPTDEVATWLQVADLLFHTSRKESQGRVILEAMAARLPVVAYDVGGVHESLLHEETGFLVPFEDSDAAGKILRRLVDDKSLREAMGACGLRRVREHFTEEDSGRKVQNIIGWALSDKLGTRLPREALPA